MAGIVVLHPVSNNGLCDGLSDGVNLRSVATTRDADADVDCRQVLLSEHQNGFIDLVAERGGLDETQRLAVDADEATALLCMGDSSSRLKSKQIVHPNCRDTEEIARVSLNVRSICKRSPHLFLAKCLDSVCSGHDEFYRPRILLCAAQESVVVGENSWAADKQTSKQ